MKKIIQSILKNGYTTTKKYTEQDFIRYLYPLKYIIETKFEGFIGCKRNSFWDYSNKENQIQLMHDVSQIHKANVTDRSYFHILNRFENGDRYGIEI